MRTIRMGVAAATAALSLAACTHALEVRNLDEYKAASQAPLTRPLTIGVEADQDDPASEELARRIGASLSRSSAKVIYPYLTGNSAPVDVVARIKVNAEGKGSGWNFPLTFPGFIVWAPAWNGYVYEVNYDIGMRSEERRVGKECRSRW